MRAVGYRTVTSASTDASRSVAMSAPTTSALRFLNKEIWNAFSSLFFQNGAMNREPPERTRNLARVFLESVKYHDFPL